MILATAIEHYSKVIKFLESDYTGLIFRIINYYGLQ